MTSANARDPCIKLGIPTDSQEGTLLDEADAEVCHAKGARPPGALENETQERAKT